MKPLRILLADDHALFRAGLRALLKELGAGSATPSAEFDAGGCGRPRRR